MTVAVCRGAQLAESTKFIDELAKMELWVQLKLKRALTPEERTDLARFRAWLWSMFELAAGTTYELAPPPTLAERLDGDHRIRRRPIRTAGGLAKHKARKAYELRQEPDESDPLIVTVTPAAQIKPKRPPVRGFGAGAELARLQRGGH
jgi:hypothetical protein